MWKAAMLAGTALTAVFVSSAARAASQPTRAPAATSSQQSPDAQSQTAAAETSDADTASADIIVTAQRRAERLQDVPLSLTVQTGEDLTRQRITSTRELAAAIPGLTVTYNGSWAQPTIRGITGTSAQAGNDAPVPIYIDGVYHPNQVSNTFELADIQQIEVLKGPQGTLFGRNAVGGAIRVTTIEPSTTTAGLAEVTLGKYTDGGEGWKQQFRGYISGSIAGDAVLGSLSVVGSRDQGYFERADNHRRTGGIERGTVRGKLLFKPSSDWKIGLSAYYSAADDYAAQIVQADNNNNTIGKRSAPTLPLPKTPWETAFNDLGRPRTQITDYGSSASVEGDLGFATLNTITALSFTRSTVQGDPDASYAPITYVSAQQTDRPFQQEITISSASSKDFNWIIGAFYYSNHSTFHNYGTGVAGYVDTDAWAGFSEATLQVVPHLFVTGGLRYSSEQKIQHAASAGVTAVFPNTAPFPANIAQLGPSYRWNSLTPRASIRFEIDPSASVYATYTKGFKSGAFSISALSPLAVNPENVQAYEVGFKVARGNVRFSAAAFHYDWTDLQVAVQTTVNGQLFTSLANAASAKITGLELEGNWRPTPSLELRGTISYVPQSKYDRYANAIVFTQRPDLLGGNTQNSIDVSGRRLIRSPEFTGSVGATYTIELEGSSLRLSSDLYHSSSFVWEPLGQVRSDAYTTLAAQATWRLEDSGVSLSIYGKNLTNAAYHTMAVPNVLADAVQYAAPREIGVSAAIKF